MRNRAGGLKLVVPVVLITAIGIVARLRPPGSAAPPLPEPEQLETGENLALQAACYQHARSVYAKLGYPKGRIAGFGNHYNQKLGKCFLDVMNMETAGPDTLWMYDRVVETVSGTAYGTYAALVRPERATPDTPRQCEVTLPSGELRLCRSEVEFAELVDVYLEEE